MTRKEELLKKLHTAMCNDNEHQCNRLNNYIHTDEYLTAEVVQVVREIVEEATKELEKENQALKQEWEINRNTIAGYDEFCNKYMELEKENAELKKEGKKSFNDWLDVCDKYGKVNLKLSKAKEILSKLLEEEKSNMYWEMNGSDKSSYYEVIKQAKQFLKE